MTRLGARLNRASLSLMAAALLALAIGVALLVTGADAGAAASAGSPLWARMCGPAAHGNRVRVGRATNLPSVVRAHGAGTTYCIAAGVHRETAPIIPRRGDVFVGAAGAVLSGARELDGVFIRRGGVWAAAGQPESNTQAAGRCLSNRPCADANDVFFDGRPLHRVEQQSDVGPGDFSFDHDAHEITIGNDPQGHRVEVAVTTRAFEGWGTRADHVQILGLTIEMFANEAQSGAVNGRPSWVVARCDVLLNHGIGVNAVGTVVNSHIHDNGQLGLGADGLAHGLFARDEIDHNNYAGFDPTWEAGGAKWLRSSNVVVRDNRVHDNRGPGLWADTDNVDTTYTGNRVYDNLGPGIDHEASQRASITNNRLVRNGSGASGWLDGAGILVNSSENLTIEGNVVADNRDGIGLVQADRGSGPRGRYLLRNVRVLRNDVTMHEGRTGLVNDTNDPALYTSNGNRFDGNRYRLGCNRSAFAWASAPGSGAYAYIGVAAWRAAGNDRHGSFTRSCSGRN
jgi:parallel beta-helix repeat protein